MMSSPVAVGMEKKVETAAAEMTQHPRVAWAEGGWNFFFFFFFLPVHGAHGHVGRMEG